MSAASSRFLTITLSPRISARVQSAAKRRNQRPQQVVEDACRRHLSAGAESIEDLENQYVQGYRRIPENTTMLEALLADLPPEAD